MQIPIAVISFNRPHFLAQTLESLRNQEGYDADLYDIHLFQDGAVNKWSRMRYAEQADINEAIDTFRRFFPKGQVHYAGANVGICESFCAAETFMFQTKRAETAWFFEDDMVLSPVYFQMMAKLDAFARRTPRVAYFAAYGNYYATAPEIVENRRSIIALDHHWAFGLRREAWERMQPALQSYYSLVRNKDYARRYHREIFAYFAQAGMVPRGSSQDAAKAWVCARLHLVRLRTFVPFAGYIGTHGAHMTAEMFRELGFGKTEISTMPVVDLKLPDDNTLTDMVDDQRRLLFEIYQQEYEKIISNLPARKLNPARDCTESDIRGLYQLLLYRDPETDVFTKHIGKTPVYRLTQGALQSVEFKRIRDRIFTNLQYDPSRTLKAYELTEAYRLILHRDPDRSAQIEHLAQVNNASETIIRLVDSNESRSIYQCLDLERS